MWPSTLTPERTYRFFKNVYDNYGRKKSMEEREGSARAPHHHLLERQASTPRAPHLAPSPPSTLSSASLTPSTPSTPSAVLATLANPQNATHQYERPISPDRPFLTPSPHRSPRSSPVYATYRQLSSPQLARRESLHQRRLSYRSSASDAPLKPSTSLVGGNENESSGAKNDARTVVLDKYASEINAPNGETGGLTICGGSEVGLQSIYISRVAEGSAAEKCHLRPGDQILSANYVSFLDGITCNRAYQVLASADRQVVLTVVPRHQTFAPRQRRHHCFGWVDPNGISVSPPPPDRLDQYGQCQLPDPSSPSEDGHVVRFRRAPLLRDLARSSTGSVGLGPPGSKLDHFSVYPHRKPILDQVRQVTIQLEKGVDLGLMIRGGIEYGLGIYVTRVDANSLVDKAGLRVGDQILSVNNYDFSEVLHDEAVDILKSSPRLSMQVRYIGKVPASTFSQMEPSVPTGNEWPSRYHTSSSSSNSGELKNYLSLTSSTASSSVQVKSGEQRSSSKLSGSPHHAPRLSPLGHSNSSPCTSPTARHRHSLHQVHTFHSEGLVPHVSHYLQSESMTNLVTPHTSFDKRDTPTLLITDSENRSLLTRIDSESNEEDEHLFVLADRTDVSRFRHRLQNSKSEEEEAMLDEECIKYLSDHERITLAYYRNEYVTGAMTIDAFVALLLELLNTNQKYSIIRHLHHVIRREDVDRFDELVYKREEQAVLKSKTLPEAIKFKNFFTKQDSSENSSFDCANEDGSGFAPMLSLSSVPRPVSSGAASPGYMSQLDVNPNPHQDCLHLSEGQMPGNNRDCMVRHNMVTASQQPSPNSAAYRKTFMTRRHSSGTSDTPIVRDITSPQATITGFGSYPLVTDERRWSIAAAEYRRSSVLCAPRDFRRSPSPVTTIRDDPSAHVFPSNYHQFKKHTNVLEPLPFMGFDVFSAKQLSKSTQNSLDKCKGGVLEEANSHGKLDADGSRRLSRKGSNSSCCQETIVEDTEGDEDEHQRQLEPPPSSPGLGSASGTVRGSGNHLHVPNLAGDSDSDDSEHMFASHLRVRRHRSLPSPTFSGPTSPSFAHQQRSSSFRLPRLQSHRAISEPNGRWRIKVKKTKSFLGIAIEGGTNVSTQSQPRIISIHSAGAAIECGDLHVGHIILEVDGESTANFNHEQVAQMISRAYYNTPHKDYVEFLVREKSRNEFDLRRSSFMLLNNSFE